MSELNLVVFDVDGTLVDSQAHIYAAMERGFQGLGLTTPERDQVLKIVGLSLPEAIAQLAPDQSVATQAALVEGYKSGYMSLRSEGAETLSPLFSGAREALEHLRTMPSTLLGVATGKSRRGLDHLITQHALHGYFLTLQVADDHPSKPHPSMLEQASKETGVDGGRAIMVGDTEYDISMARAAGYTAVGVSWGYHAPDRLRKAGAHTIVEDFGELLDIIETHKGQA